MHYSIYLFYDPRNVALKSLSAMPSLVAHLPTSGFTSHRTSRYTNTIRSLYLQCNRMLLIHPQRSMAEIRHCGNCELLVNCLATLGGGGGGWKYCRRRKETLKLLFLSTRRMQQGVLLLFKNRHDANNGGVTASGR